MQRIPKKSIGYGFFLFPNLTQWLNCKENNSWGKWHIIEYLEYKEHITTCNTLNEMYTVKEYNIIMNGPYYNVKQIMIRIYANTAMNNNLVYNEYKQITMLGI